MNLKLTSLEEKVLKNAIAEGFFYDDLDDKFICWGFYGKRERGAASSLVQKGLITVSYADGDTIVTTNIPKREMLKLLNIHPELWKENND